ncbi:AAA family ATPase [Gordonia sp. TBRC 11910]|uniref:AAA family ATPase n=1 Tax=Gordonia asplenii TaxID=2725283 RepID=A0A848KQ72_9ACTN|nr:AAA family ATPase [Gordonia asplenii]NMO00179.1 AAA family ATPase [Gordonia asplenii]
MTNDDTGPSTASARASVATPAATSDDASTPDAPLPPWLPESGPVTPSPPRNAPLESGPTPAAPFSDAATTAQPIPPRPGPPGQFDARSHMPNTSGQFDAPGRSGPGQFSPHGQFPTHGFLPPQGQFIAGPAQPAPPFGHPAHQRPPAGPPALDDATLLRKARRAPGHGWRRAVHRATGGRVNPGESPTEITHQQLVERVNRPVRGDYRIAVLSLKGGVGKTTTTIGLGSTFASMRGDRVIAVDANPDLGTLAQRVPQQTDSTVRDLLADEAVHRYSDVRAHTSQAPSRLEVLASERDPAMAEAFNEDEYKGVMEILQRYYNIIITDCGTGLSHSAMRGVLNSANAIVLVSSPALDGARSASATLDWLEAHGYGHLVPRSVLVLSSSRPGSSTIDTDQLAAHFLSRCRAVQGIPFDDHLAEGSHVDLDLVGKNARAALLELAAVIADDFGGTVLRREEPFTP